MKILQGDCLETLKALDAGIVQTCVTSPPYYGLRSYIEDGHVDKPLEIGLEQSPEEYIEKLVAVFREVRRVLKDDGTVFLNLGDSYWGGKGQSGSRGAEHQKVRNDNGASLNRDYQTLGGQGETRPTDASHDVYKPKDLMMMPARVALALQADGWYLRSDIIWAKPNPMPESVKDRPTKSHEHIFLLSKNQKYYYDADAIREAQDPASLDRLKRGWNGNGERGYPNGPQNHIKDYMGKTDEEIAELKGRNKRDVWTVTTRSYKGAHFATFPPALIEPCILAGSAKGDIVLDPFNGSGTTGAVALQHGRDYIGCELNPEYIELSHKRMAGVQPAL